MATISTITPFLSHHHPLRRCFVPRPPTLSQTVSLALPSDSSQDTSTYAPLVSALKSVGEDNAAGFHFPGHNRGQAAPSQLTELIGEKPYAYDLTGLPPLVNSILDAQKRAAEVFGASETWFLIGGTTCGVQAAVMATCSPGDTIILPRNCHASAISGLVFSGATPKFTIPDYQSEWEIAAPVTPSQVDRAIKELESQGGRKPAAVFITSPTYQGVCSNVRKISELCNSNDIPLIVDEAHGAHFGFHPQLPSSSLNQGADLAIQSTHKGLMLSFSILYATQFRRKTYRQWKSKQMSSESSKH